MRRGKNRSTQRKTSWSKRENQQQTQPTYIIDTRTQTQATLVGGKCSGFSIEGGNRRLIAAYFGIYSRLLCVYTSGFAEEPPTLSVHDHLLLKNLLRTLSALTISPLFLHIFIISYCLHDNHQERKVLLALTKLILSFLP